MSFSNELELAKAIEDGLLETKSHKGNFISLMNTYVDTRSDGEVTYYESLGYDSLIPNKNFARLFNINGEIKVDDKIVKVTPHGTFLFPQSFDLCIDDYVNKLDYSNLNNIDSIIYLDHNILLYRTFLQSPNMDVIEYGDTTEYSDEYLDNMIQTRGIPEPDYNSFQTFNADRGGHFGKLIQNIIGSNKAATINFSNKKRLKGSFYFYNYGVYSEIGARGWTDHKNVIGWGKARCQKIRVSWKNVVIRKSAPSYYAESWTGMRKIQNLQAVYNNPNCIMHIPPRIISVSNRNLNTVTFLVTNETLGLIKTNLPQGVKSVMKALERIAGNKVEGGEDVQAAILATDTHIYFVSNSEEIIKYEEKEYTHVFDNYWMTIVASWNSATGLSVNGININDYAKYTSYVKVLSRAFSESRPQLKAGEVTVCARFGDVWKGMRIVKKDEL